MFGRRESPAASTARRDFVVVRQEFDGAVEPPRFLEELHEAPLRVQQKRGNAAGHAQHLRLEIVVAQHERRNIVGHFRKLHVSLLFA